MENVSMHPSLGQINFQRGNGWSACFFQSSSPWITFKINTWIHYRKTKKRRKLIWRLLKNDSIYLFLFPVLTFTHQISRASDSNCSSLFKRTSSVMVLSLLAQSSACSSIVESSVSGPCLRASAAAAICCRWRVRTCLSERSRGVAHCHWSSEGSSSLGKESEKDGKQTWQEMKSSPVRSHGANDVCSTCWLINIFFLKQRTKIIVTKNN